ncbi:MAG: manganese efflux pump MntP family protein [Bacteroidales bacterium]|jgi:putative Mn2+ efflux pump MntP|nr:manganese efflux pump MntP family protein [Bacteroidales bacterium]MCU0410013.1 manganese efflux pump MntP family protein [Bacteroidales bacterium]
MDLITITGIALGLSFDTFAVSLSCGVVESRIRFREAIPIAFTLALFQGALPVLGYFLGSTVSRHIGSFDHWVAFSLLMFLGVRMIIEGLKESDRKRVVNYRRLPVLLTMAIGTSIDAFAVGISFAFLNVRIWIAGLIIGTVTFIASMTAIRIGKSAGSHLGQRVEILGGIILASIGIKILAEHLLSAG